MHRKIMLILISLLVLTSLSGCWSRRELNDLAIVLALGVDKIGDQFEVSVQVVGPREVSAKGGGGQSSPVVTYHAVGETVIEAIRRMSTITARKTYYSHIRMLILGEKLAKEGIKDALDIMSRDHEFRTDFFVAVAKGTTARNILGFFTPLELVPANKLYNSLETSQKNWAPTLQVHLDELIDSLTSTGTNPTLTGIRIQGDAQMGRLKENSRRIDPPALLEFSGIGVFNKDKLIGWLNESESIGLNYIMDHVKSTINVIRCPQGGKIANEVINSHTKVSGHVVNGEPQIRVKIELEQNVADVGCKLDLTKQQTMHELNQRTSKNVLDRVQKVIRTAQDTYNIDFLGFGDTIRRDQPQLWKKYEQRWDSYFKRLKVTVNVKVKTRRLGTVSNSFLQEMKE
ncbi:Ger(x)C family spore germination protein [Paenibacillus guangzhouensis]|uniref:Ger(x)C family spore germination protein n=1 Tax=Paenibacillus guangzhouensis TaxID=1473112 RepID=UPI00126775B5|nr:Ger(x)C family spore germination protein [Paenibacillus guangzhouensis]